MIQSKIVEESHRIKLFNERQRVFEDFVLDVEFKLWCDYDYGADIDGNRGTLKYSFDVVDIYNVRKNGKYLRILSPQMRMRIIEELEPKTGWND